MVGNVSAKQDDAALETGSTVRYTTDIHFSHAKHRSLLYTLRTRRFVDLMNRSLLSARFAMKIGLGSSAA